MELNFLIIRQLLSIFWLFNIFCLYIFVITSTLKNHWVNNAKYLLDILEDE